MNLELFLKTNSNKKIYIYGYSMLGKQVKEYAKSLGIEISGFVVSEGYLIEISGENIYSLKQLPCYEKQNLAIVVTVKSYHFNSIIPEIIRSGIDNVYFLTGVEEFCKLARYNTFYYDINLSTDEVYKAQNHFYAVAKKILGYIFSFVETSTIIDFGCGAGTWLKAAKELNSNIKVLGLDCSDVDRSDCLNADEFTNVNFESYIYEGNKFDLAISIEVAEHIEEENADRFVENICKSSDIVLFGAAVKYQGGDHHVNEQFPSYWVKKFEKNGYKYIDCVRPHFWEDSDIDMIYKENIVLYVKNDSLYFDLIKKIPQEKEVFLDWIHPDLYQHKMEAALWGAIK